MKNLKEYVNESLLDDEEDLLDKGVMKVMDSLPLQKTIYDRVYRKRFSPGNSCTDATGQKLSVGDFVLCSDTTGGMDMTQFLNVGLIADFEEGDKGMMVKIILEGEYDFNDPDKNRWQISRRYCGHVLKISNTMAKKMYK